MNREEKAELIKKLNSTFINAGDVVVTHQSGLTVDESTREIVKFSLKDKFPTGKYLRHGEVIPW